MIITMRGTRASTVVVILKGLVSCSTGRGGETALSFSTFPNGRRTAQQVEAGNQPFPFRYRGGEPPCFLFSISVPFFIPDGKRNLRGYAKYTPVIVAYSTDRPLSRVESWSHTRSRLIRIRAQRSCSLSCCMVQNRTGVLKWQRRAMQNKGKEGMKSCLLIPSFLASSCIP